MDEIARNTAPDPAADGDKWIGRLLIAVILGEGIWGLVVSLTHNLILPLLAKGFHERESYIEIAESRKMRLPGRAKIQR